jgi:hypothetical protein
MKSQEIINKANALIHQGGSVLETEITSSHSQPKVNEEAFHEFRIATISFLGRTLGTHHACYQSFHNEVTHPTASRTRRGIAALKAARQEFEGGWLEKTRDQITKSVLNDLLRQARHYFERNQHQAALLLAGAVVTEMLRLKCSNAGISLHNKLQEKAAAKSGLQLSGEAYKKKLIDRQQHKEVNGWLEIAADAAEKAPSHSEQKIGKILGGIQSWIAGSARFTEK